MPTIISWRKPTRMRKGSTINWALIPPGAADSDLDIDFDLVPKKSLVEMVSRAKRHMDNNEVISHVMALEGKAKDEGTLSSFDHTAEAWKRRLFYKNAVMNGTLGESRASSAPAPVDRLTYFMQFKMHERLLVVATRNKLEGFPSVFNAQTGKTIISPRSGKTLAQQIDGMIATDSVENARIKLDDGTIGSVRMWAQQEVDKEKAAVADAANADETDDFAASAFDDDDSEDESETEDAETAPVAAK